MPFDPPRSEHLLPPNSTPLERALSASDHRMLSLPSSPPRDVWDPDRCPERLLPYLAQAWSVDEWDPAWTEAQKRQAIKDALWLHRHKGTVGAMRRALAQVGFAVTLKEWFEPLSEAAQRAFTGRSPALDARRPYTFRLVVDLAAGATWTLEQLARLRRVAIGAKNVRSYLEMISVRSVAVKAPVAIGLGLTTTAHVRITLEVPTEIKPLPARVYAGVGSHTTARIRFLIPD